MNTHDSLIRLFKRRIENVFPDKDVVIQRLANEKLRIYLGVDPTGATIHLGHTVPLLLLKELADLGHEIILLIGDFTARIGDPTDKTSARTALSAEEVMVNMQTYLDQIKPILPPESYTLKYNSHWLEGMSMKDVVELSAHVTVQQMLARDMFQERLKEQKPIYIHEFLYPLLQGYDSVAMEVDGEVGGNDQTFNMLVGRDLEAALLKKDKLVLATRLLVNPVTGKKMSKTEGNLIGLADAPEDMYGKVMASIPDEMIRTVFELCTAVDIEKIDELDESLENPRDFKAALAFELVTMYHGRNAAEKARAAFEAISQGSVPDEVPEFELAGSAKLVDVLVESGLVASKSDAKRLIDQKGVSIDGEAVTSWDKEVKKGDVLKVGSHRFLKIV